MFFCFTVDDVGMEGYSSEAHLENLLGFLREEEVLATFFPVPRAQGVPFGERTAYVRLLQAARDAGHEVAQHGIEHDRFEVGIPPAMVLELPHEGRARERLHRDRAAIEASFAPSPLRRRLAEGRRILEDALAAPIVGFRAPCLQMSANLLPALEAEGYRYDSSLYLQPAGWDLLNGRLDAAPVPIAGSDAARRRHCGRLRLLPLTTDYTWYLDRARFDVTLALARHDFLACLEADIPFVPLTHVSPIQEGPGNRGFELCRQLIAFARETCAARGLVLTFAPLAEACGGADVLERKGVRRQVSGGEAS